MAVENTGRVMMSENSKYEVTHARHEPAHVLAPGLFRTLKRGDRKHQKLDITYNHGDEVVRFIGFEPLADDDLRVLVGIVALAGLNGKLLTPEPKTKTGKELRERLETKLDAANQDGLVVRESLTKLLREIGLTDGSDNIKSLKASLVRMSNVNVVVTRGNRQASFNLMSYALDEGTGKLWIALNPRVTAAVLGKTQYRRFEMDEVRAIRSGPTLIMHNRLCGWINQGKSGRIDLDTLCSYIYQEKTSDNTMRKRRWSTRKALSELASLDGWNVTEYARGKFKIKRPVESD